MIKFSAKKFMEYNSKKGFEITEYKRQMAAACDGQKITISKAGIRTVAGIDGRTYFAYREEWAEEETA